MPKAFSEQERQTIRQRLMDEGLMRFTRVGVRAMRIDELCRDVGIAKGSFYSFFESKEALFFALADDHDIRHKVEIMVDIDAMTGDVAAIVGFFFDSIMARLKTDPLVLLMKDAGELAYVMRHAPPGYVVANRQRDRDFLKDLASVLATRFGLHHADTDTLESLLTLTFTLSLQQDNLEAMQVYAPTEALLREMFITRVIKGPFHD